MKRDNILIDRSTQEFDTLVATIPDIVYKIDGDGKFTYLNLAIRILGYEPIDLIGKHFSEIILPVDITKVSREYVLPEYAGKITGDKNAPKLFDERRGFERKTTRLEVRLIPKEKNNNRIGIIESISQNCVTAEVNSAGIYETNAGAKNKVFIGTVGIIRDINDQRWMETELIKYAEHLEELVANRTEELKKANERLQYVVNELKASEDLSTTILENSPIGIYIVQNKVLKYVNIQFANAFNCRREQIIGKNPLELILSEDRERVHMQAVQMLKKGSRDAYEYRVCDANGHIKWIMETVVSIQYQGKQAILGNFIDITNRKHSEEKLQEGHEQLQKTLKGITHAIAATIELRDPYTAGHQTRVAQLAQAIALELNLPEELADQIYTAGLIHDIGKISIPAEILSKPGNLNDVEYSLIKMHPQASYNILENIDFPCPVARWVLEHHELLDGSGYPNGLKGDQISLQARILTVADVFEAMSSHRPYRASLGTDEAIKEINEKKGKQYDSDVVDACLRLFTEKGFKFN